MLFLPFWFVLQLLGAAAGFGQVGDAGGGVAYFAHIGGFLFGLVAVKLLDRGPPRPGYAW
jgi:membrane associated rhomboid family serine protease